MRPSEQLIQAIAVCAELTGTEMSPAAARVMASDLSRYPESHVLGALTKCRRELRSRLTLADVIGRLDDGRPGAEEAWAMIPKSEYETAIWTEEMSEAMSVANGLLEDGDSVAARMAFKEGYSRLCQVARDRGEPVRWSVSLGWDKSGRESVLAKAVELGRLTEDQVRIYLPSFIAPTSALTVQIAALADKMAR